MNELAMEIWKTEDICFLVRRSPAAPFALLFTLCAFNLTLQGYMTNWHFFHLVRPQKNAYFTMTDLTTHCVKRRLFVQKLDCEENSQVNLFEFWRQSFDLFLDFWSLKCTISLIFNAKNEILTEKCSISFPDFCYQSFQLKKEFLRRK